MATSLHPAIRGNMLFSLHAGSWGFSVMKRIIPVVLIAVFAIYAYEKRTGRNLGVSMTLEKSAGVVDSFTGTNLSGAFAGGYGMATGVGGSVKGGAGGLASGVSNNMGAVFGN